MTQSLPRYARFARFAALSVLPLLAACAGTGQVKSTAAAAGTVTVGVLALNDFHGALEPPRLSLTVADGKGGTAALSGQRSRRDPRQICAKPDRLGWRPDQRVAACLFDLPRRTGDRRRQPDRARFQRGRQS